MQKTKWERAMIEAQQRAVAEQLRQFDAARAELVPWPDKGDTQPMTRLRITSRGWFRVAASWLLGPSDIHYPRIKRAEVLIGPFDRPEAAYGSAREEPADE